MEIEIKAAKNLLEETSCYQCRYIDDITKACGLHLKDLPEILSCGDWISNKIRGKMQAQWSQATIQDLESWMGVDVETELIKAATIELEKEIGLTK